MLSTNLGRCQSERGASAVEYGLLVALIAAVIVGVVVVLSPEILGLFGIAHDPAWSGE